MMFVTRTDYAHFRTDRALTANGFFTMDKAVEKNIPAFCISIINDRQQKCKPE